MKIVDLFNSADVKGHKGGAPSLSTELETSVLADIFSGEALYCYDNLMLNKEEYKKAKMKGAVKKEWYVYQEPSIARLSENEFLVINQDGSQGEIVVVENNLKIPRRVINDPALLDSLIEILDRLESNTNIDT